MGGIACYTEPKCNGIGIDKGKYKTLKIKAYKISGV
jgi:hypothetical protein